jgi:hypothetical protein
MRRKSIKWSKLRSKNVCGVGSKHYSDDDKIKYKMIRMSSNNEQGRRII